MIKTPRWAGTALALWAAFQVSACDSPSALEAPETPIEQPGAPAEPNEPGQPQPAPDTAFAITDVSALRPGQTVTLRGTNMGRLSDLVADGQPVEFTVYDDSTAEFQMPAESTCDVDARPVELIANGGVRHEGPLDLESTIRLEVGESRILAAEDLECLRINGNDEDYVLSAASFTKEKVEETLFTVQSVGLSPTAAGMSAMQQGALATIDSATAHMEAVASMATPLDGAQMSSMDDGELHEFDAYSTAEVGDTVRVVDWSQSASRGERDQVPTYDAVVVGASREHLLVVDTRSLDASRYQSADVLDRLDRGLAIADEYLGPAMRAVIDPQFSMPQGAGGRMLSVIRPIPHAAGFANPSDLDMSRPAASDMFGAYVTENVDNYSPGGLASLIIHEAAHVAEHYYEREGRGIRSGGWFMESIARNVEDMASRMGMGTPHQAHWESTHGNDAISSSPISISPSYGAMQDSPWGLPGGTIGQGGPGAYDRGARIVRYAAAKIGAGGFAPAQTLYQILSSRASALDDDNIGATFDDWVRSWQIEAIADAIGMSVEDLLEESMMADLTDDLVPDAAVARWGLPQIEGWDHTRSNPNASRYRWVKSSQVIDRDQGMSEVAHVPAGGYAYWYIPAGTRGISLQADNVDLREHHQVRLTRLR